ncbi:hypothetical protein [Streptomyces fructofermentans]
MRAQFIADSVYFAERQDLSCCGFVAEPLSVESEDRECHRS